MNASDKGIFRAGGCLFLCLGIGLLSLTAVATLYLAPNLDLDEENSYDLVIALWLGSMISAILSLALIRIGWKNITKSR